MAVIRREIEIDAAPTAARDSWEYFLQWVRTSQHRLACDELACTDAVGTGVVRFEPAQAGRARVSVQIESDGGPAPDVVSQQIVHDLLVFKDYVEHHRGDWAVRGDDASRLHDDERHNRPARQRLPEENPNSPTGSSFTTRWPT